MDELLAYLDAIAPLSPFLRDHVTRIMREQSLRRKAYLFRAGKINREVHFVVRGMIRCYKVQADDKEINKWFFTEGNFLAYRQSYDRGLPCFEDYQALEPSIVLTSTFEDLDRIYRQYPEFLLHGLVITGRFASLWYNVSDIRSGLSAEERYQTFINHYPNLFSRVPIRYLASFLDLHETTLYKIRGNR